MKTLQIIFFEKTRHLAHAAIAHLLPQLLVTWETAFACSITYDAGVPYYTEIVEEFIFVNDALIEDYRFVPCDNDLVEIQLPSPINTI